MTDFNLLNILLEERNPAFTRDELTREVWDAIDEKQKQLQKDVFGALGDELLDITKEKAEVMGYEHLTVPRTICGAGNGKLPANVLIVNMSSSLMCPSFYFGICTIKNGACYAQRDENRLTVNVLPNRWQTDLMHTQMLQQYKNGNKKPMDDYFSLIEMYINVANAYCKRSIKKDLENLKQKKAKKGKELTQEEREKIISKYEKYKITDVRLNETGDFQCQLAVDLWTDFAKKIQKRYGIKTHAYTARNLDFSRASQVMAVNASHGGIELGDVDERKYKAVDDKIYNSLKGGDKVVDGQPVLGVRGKKNKIYYYKCPCSDGLSACGDCRVCYDRNKTGVPYTIYVRYHGITAAKGLKKLFTKEEIQRVVEKLYANGWMTDDEYRSWSRKKNQERLDTLSRNITDRRKDTRKYTRKKKSTKKKSGKK